MLNLDNAAWWKVQMPDRTDDGELVLTPVRLKFRLYTRAELRQRKASRLEQGIADLRRALDDASAAKTPEDLRAAAESLQTASAAFLDGEADDDAELAARVLDWRADDVSGEPFSPALLSALLADEARFRAIQQALDDASHGAPRKN